jgi:regulator of protease activity HflC (stomatin/prohibitin superfamily)
MLTIATLAIVSTVLVSGARVERQDSGHVGVVRNGGALDNRRIRQILMPGQRVTWTGLFSQAPREYPSARVVLFYTITSDTTRGDRREVDVVRVPTRDGVLVGLQGTVFFHFTGERDIRLLKRFDQTFGTRRFPVAGSARTLFPWDGEDGFGAMLDSTFRPVLDNDLRTEIGAFHCAELVASCALVRRAPAASPTSRNTNANIRRVEDALNRSLMDDLNRTLGGNYFRDVHVRLAHVTLPAGVQDAVNTVQQEYVAVNGAKAELSKARYEALRNKLRAEAYNDSPALARIDAVKAAPPGATIVLSGGDKQPGINVGG